MAQQLLDFFNAKVESVRHSTGNCPVQTTLGPAPAAFDQFELCYADDIQRVISVSQSKTCELDPLPTDVLKQFLPQLLPYITDRCNASLQEGCLPMSQRHAIVTPRLEKSGLDASVAKNYKPVSNLTFMSKVVERLVCRQLVDFLSLLDKNSLLPRRKPVSV